MKKVFWLCLLLSSFQYSIAQSNYQALIAAKDYTGALSLAEERLNEAPTDSLALLVQGICQLQTGHPKLALKSLQAAEKNYRPKSLVWVNQAKCYAQLEQKDAALALMDSLAGSSFGSYSLFADPLLEPLYEEGPYKAAKDSIYQRAFPCFASPEHRHFDFWLGEWEVFVGNTKVGDNTISRQDGGCMLLEQYTTARDYVGQSTNFYDPHDDKWKQIWIDNTGSVSKYVESERRPGYLQLISTPESTPSQPILRMTFSLQEDGSVRQFIEQKTEEEWQAVFDGKYVKQ